ncbi:excisionase family DNA-binding protein [Aquibacillus albus]|uniref:Excisionase family DNA binding protein n=1 Tax=Aquibacillus albus TaxID=1168171 RepID=A0ABS2MV59_9BACI|nr:excisionase family DNA-binding protein [Aquibacillus albus]MBM7569731.1 excisionase family DNA binding protein [Aquibacillus albus]
MYLTIKETSKYLGLNEQTVQKLINDNRIRAVDDGEQFLINKDQFTTHLDQLEKYKERIQEILNEPIPEDIDIKDED